jgi:hypothetical protein
MLAVVVTDTRRTYHEPAHRDKYEYSRAQTQCSILCVGLATNKSSGVVVLWEGDCSGALATITAAVWLRRLRHRHATWCQMLLKCRHTAGGTYQLRCILKIAEIMTSCACRQPDSENKVSICPPTPGVARGWFPRPGMTFVHD